MTNRPEAIIFKNRNGQKLFGTLHRPDFRDNLCPMIVLLSPGVKMRVGPHRLYNRMTETLNELGFAVFKFDFFGLGDSEGELDRELLAEVYDDIETGAFVNDGVDALDWLEANLGAKSFLLGGLCGGAITSLLLAKDDKRVVGLISLGMTVTLAMGATDSRKFTTQGELAALREGYVRRILSPKSWFRLLTFRSDFGMILRSLGQLFRKKKTTAAGTPGENGGKALISNVNPQFVPAFFDMARANRKILLIFSESDRLFWEFDEKFAQPYATQLSEVRDAYELHVVRHANHVFSFREWEKDMLQLIIDWIQTNFAAPEKDAGT